MVADEFLNVGFVFNDQDARSGNHGHSLSKEGGHLKRSTRI